MWRAFRIFGSNNALRDVQFVIDHDLMINDTTADGSPWDMDEVYPPSALPTRGEQFE